MTKKQSETEIQELILETIRAEKPETTQQLINLMHEKTNLPEKEITRVILELESQNKIRFTKPENPPSTEAAHVFSSKYAWYWITIALAVATTLAVFTIPEDAYPIVYVRQA
ncbi:MAG: hypothetical protein NWE95_13645, partial [Candidatus Bathyarchaeota archaeon]|nr:hypothetical protein [Candidatus Bathyarchaeota archaeon]